jgi:hypothetical protein
MSWNYPTAYLNLFMYPVWTNVSNVYTQQGYVYIATDGSGNIIQNQCMFRDTSNNFHRVTAITASGNLTQGGSLDFTIDTGVHFPNGTCPANAPSTSFAFTGIFSTGLAEVQTNWGAGHQSGAKEAAA